MDSHVRVLGWLYVVCGGLGVLTAVAVLGGSVAISSILGVSGDDAILPSHIVALVGGVITLFTLALSLPALILGYGLLHFMPWARIFGFILGGLSLFHVPVGTALGLYTFWVLLNPQTEVLFNRPR